jgi:hypothetical protein
MRLDKIKYSLLGLVLLAACTQDPKTPTPPAPDDKTPPTIVSQTPADKEQNVSVQTAITVTFSEAVQATTVTDASVIFAGSGSVNLAKTLSLSSDGRTLTIKPVSAIPTPNTLSVNLTSGISDVAGNPLAAAAWSWTQPSWLTLGQNPVLSLTKQNLNPGSYLRLDEAGNPILFSNQSPPVQGLLRRWDSSTWQNAPLPSQIDFFHDLVADKTGNLIVAGRSLDDDADYVTKWDGNSWQNLGGDLNVASATFFAKLALEKDGNPIIARSESGNSSNYDLYVQRWDGQNWQQLGGQLEVKDGIIYSFDLVVDPYDNPIVIWTEDLIAYAKRWSPTSATWELLGASIPDKQGSVTSSAINSKGEVLTTARSIDGVFILHYTASGWETLTPVISGNPGKNYGSIRLILDSDGNPVLSWAEYSNDSSSVYVARYINQTWQRLGEAITAPTTNQQELVSPSVVLDTQGVPILSYVFSNIQEGFPSNTYTLKTYVMRLNQ